MGNVNEKEVLSEPIDTQYGKIIGRRIIHEGDRQVNAFQGVPFAKAPVGELRFKRPVPPDPWFDKVLKTTAFKARPIQDEKKEHKFIPRFKNAPISEDCLYLNVFTPAWTFEQEKLFPVMVFVHGGGFFMDSAVKYGDIGISKILIAQCETVVVTVEYRLGYLGFFSTGDSACNDNVALWDMTMALQWVQDNIRNFHGNPDNVTLFGQSAGGASVDLLSLSPFSNALFHRLIPMSGNADCSWSIDHNAVANSRKFANKLSVIGENSDEMIKKLRSLDAHKFAIDVSGLVDVTVVGDVVCPIAPRIDGDFLTRPVKTLREQAPKKKRLIGVCECEGVMLTKSTQTLDDLESCIAHRIPEDKYENFLQLREQALKLYILPHEYANKEALLLAFAKFKSDSFLGIGTQKSVLEQIRVQNEETYLYSFDYCNPDGLFSYSPLKMPTHCIELNYLLHICMFVHYEFNDTDMKVLRIITKLWSNFAKYGDPNGSMTDAGSQLSFKWLPATADAPGRCLSIKPEPEMCDYFQEGRPLFWINLEKNSN